jgi:hypothetical protein
MEKLIKVLLLALYCPIVSAQVELEGKFEAHLPQAQVWDGRILAYTFRGSAYFYDTETDQLYEEPDHQLATMNYRKGIYLRKVDDKYQLRRVAEEEPVIPYLFSKVSGWFGDSFMGVEEVTGPNAGIFVIWYELEKGVIARHKFEDLNRAIGFDPENTPWYRNMDIHQIFSLYAFIYREGIITLKNPVSKKFGFYDLKLNRAFPGEFDGADPFFEGLAAVQNKDGLWGFIDTYGVTRIPFIYRKKPGPFHSGLAKVRDQKYQIGFIDHTGSLKIPVNYSEATYFYKGRSIARRSGLDGYRVILSNNGEEEKFPCKICLPQTSLFGSEANSNYFPQQDIRDFVDEGLLILHSGWQRVIINSENEKLTPQFGMIKDMVGGKAIVVEGRYLDDAAKQRFYLWDVKEKKAVVKLSFEEF